ncbi:hypothetical protein [Glycomyces buryatensis]|uniref:Uncharacterized protein n=1 Tax=Glycomyces buryatensis TaxID=2570927 RepID=A0A4S8Q073_9ACTN|nr:hypothetical protein [Glycomyces buryatensis]THV33949.1 hypothetical protein FAB82_24565 [Glycomyces buryatensis]
MNTSAKDAPQPGEGGFVFHGEVQTGVIGTGASANVGAIGENSRGLVFVGRDGAEERLFAKLLALVDELREAVAGHREALDDQLFETVESNLDELEESIEEMRPAAKIQMKLRTLETLLRPFDTLVGLITKLWELTQKSNT